VERELLERLRAHLAEARLFPEPGRALLAVSAGPDSVAMLDLLAELAPELELELSVGHVDHGILPESGDVARRVESLAGDYGVQCRVMRLELGSGASETRARSGRYDALRAMQDGAGARYLVTAHHADDQAETVLFRLLRGSGLAGLAGIPARGRGGLVRPLLPFRREELEAWLAQRGIEERVALHRDPSNADERHDRVWVRRRLLPVIGERFGSEGERRLLDVARHAGADRRAWGAALRELKELEFRLRGDSVEVARAPLARYDKTLSEALLRALAREAGCRVGPRRAARLRRFATGSSSGRVMQLGAGWDAEIAFDRVRIVPSQSVREPAAAVECGDDDEGRVSHLGHAGCEHPEGGRGGRPHRAAGCARAPQGAAAADGGAGAGAGAGQLSGAGARRRGGLGSRDLPLAPRPARAGRRRAAARGEGAGRALRRRTGPLVMEYYEGRGMNRAALVE
jgi:tRNA(Ile)-lysidine synthase